MGFGVLLRPFGYNKLHSFQSSCNLTWLVTVNYLLVCNINNPRACKFCFKSFSCRWLLYLSSHVIQRGLHIFGILSGTAILLAKMFGFLSTREILYYASTSNLFIFDA